MAQKFTTPELKTSSTWERLEEFAVSMSSTSSYVGEHYVDGVKRSTSLRQRLAA